MSRHYPSKTLRHAAFVLAALVSAVFVAAGCKPTPPAAVQLQSPCDRLYGPTTAPDPFASPDAGCPPISLEITNITPSRQIEHQPITVHYQISLAKWAHRTVTGHLDSDTGGTKMINGLAPGTSQTGDLNTTAPAAGPGQHVVISFTRSDAPGEFPIPDATTADDIVIGGRFTFAVDSIDIFDTRAPHEDTDYVGLSGAVEGEMYAENWVDLGDVNNGHYDVNLPLCQSSPTNQCTKPMPIDVWPTSKIAMDFEVVNHGYNGLGATILNTISSAAKEFLENYFQGTSWQYADKLTQWINNNVIDPDCDGMVALDVVGWTPSDLYANTSATHRVYAMSGSYPQANLSPAAHDMYTKHPLGCHDSHYTVTYSATRVS